MLLLEKLNAIWKNEDSPFLLAGNRSLRFTDIAAEEKIDLSGIHSGAVVALIGDFEPASILTLLRLIDLGAVLVPLTTDTRHEHPYFFESALVDFVIENKSIQKIQHDKTHPLLEALRAKNHAGLVLFSTGTTGRPKAILHDLTEFLKKYEVPRPALRTLNFLLFDHIGGINTLFHTLFNRGVVVAPNTRSVISILEVCQQHQVEVLPTTPTFLRLMLMSGVIPAQFPSCIKVITYGTEKMDQPTLDALCELLPGVDFRQTFGMSELGIVRVKSEARNSLFMKIGGDGVKTKIIDDVLKIHSQSRMLGYLNAPSPFDSEGWYDTKDVVEQQGEYIKVVGRTSDVINVGGLKFMASEVERVALEFPEVSLVKVYPRQNPITGQHVELIAQAKENATIDKEALALYLKSKLQAHMVPRRILCQNVQVGHRFKKG